MMRVAANDASGKVSAIIVSNATPEREEWAKENKSSKVPHFARLERFQKDILMTNQTCWHYRYSAQPNGVPRGSCKVLGTTDCWPSLRSRISHSLLRSLS